MLLEYVIIVTVIYKVEKSQIITKLSFYFFFYLTFILFVGVWWGDFKYLKSLEKENAAQNCGTQLSEEEVRGEYLSRNQTEMLIPDILADHCE